MSNVSIVRGTLKTIRAEQITVGGEVPDLTGWAAFAQIRRKSFDGLDLVLDLSEIPGAITIADPATAPAVVLTLGADVTRDLPADTLLASVKIQDTGSPEVVHEIARLSIEIIESPTVLP